MPFWLILGENSARWPPDGTIEGKPIAESACANCRLPAEDRTIPLKAIAQRTKLSVDGVEFLLMKALSLHLVEGVIDQVDSTVQVHSPFSARVLI